MSLEKMLKEESVSMQLSVPKTMNEAVEEYQTNYKNRYSEKLTKHDIIIEMMIIGFDVFLTESARMKKQYEAYNSQK